MTSSPLLLVFVPLLVAAVPMLLWEAPDWRHAAGRVGVLGLGLTLWVDLIDNCGACAEDDSVLLSGGWIVSAALVVTGAAALLVRRYQRG